jgi:glycine oxidase
VIGGSIAYHLAEAGAAVMLLERFRAGGHASRASAGLLHPLTDPDTPEPLRALSAASFAMFPTLVERLRALSGVDPQFSRPGWLRVALDPDALPAMRYRAAALATYDARVVDGDEARRLEPALSPAIIGALHLPQGAQVYVPALLTAYLHAAARLGAQVRTGVEVGELSRRGTRVTGVRTADGERIEAGHTVLAGGAWTAQLAGALGVRLPVAPLRGQILALHAIPSPLRRIVFGPGAYLAPKADGSLVVGATYEDVGFDDRLTAAGVSGLLLSAQQIAPALADATFRQAWGGLRPASPDSAPILGPLPGWEGVAVATGHTAEGVLLSPITGDVMARYIRGEPIGTDLTPFGLGRFGGA